MKKLISVMVLSAALLTARAACSATLIDRVVAIVGGDMITLSELQTEMAAPLAEINKKYRGEDLAKATDKLRRDALDSLIDKYLQIQEAKLQGIEVGDDEVDSAVKDIMDRNKMDKDAFTAALKTEGYTVADYRKNLSEQMAVLKLVNRAVKSKILVKEDEVVKEYNDNISRYSSPESVRVANISFPASGGDMDAALKNAQAARAEILAGTAFEDMAVKCTKDPGAAKTCVLGTFAHGELSAAIEDKAFKMAPGELSEPIRMDGGYQLIKIMEHTTQVVRPIEEVRQQIVEELTTKKGEGLFAKWIEGLRKHTYVEIRQ